MSLNVQLLSFKKKFEWVINSPDRNFYFSVLIALFPIVNPCAWFVTAYGNSPYHRGPLTYIPVILPHRLPQNPLYSYTETHVYNPRSHQSFSPTMPKNRRRMNRYRFKDGEVTNLGKTAKLTLDTTVFAVQIILWYRKRLDGDTFIPSP